MNYLDWIQTSCAVIAVGISFYSLKEVVKVKKKLKIDASVKKVNQRIKGNNNNQTITSRHTITNNEQ